MRAFPILLATIVVFAALAGAVPSASAADNCTGFVTSVPTVITKQGVWCLRGDLTTAANGITAIDIQTNNVTIDCNGFKLNGLPAGPATLSNAIAAYEQRSNITVRNCTIRGFRFGI